MLLYPYSYKYAAIPNFSCVVRHPPPPPPPLTCSSFSSLLRGFTLVSCCCILVWRACWMTDALALCLYCPGVSSSQCSDGSLLCLRSQIQIRARLLNAVWVACCCLVNISCKCHVPLLAFFLTSFPPISANKWIWQVEQMQMRGGCVFWMLSALCKIYACFGQRWQKTKGLTNDKILWKEKTNKMWSILK